jgi:hypothetical protein
MVNVEEWRERFQVIAGELPACLSFKLIPIGRVDAGLSPTEQLSEKPEKRVPRRAKALLGITK